MNWLIGADPTCDCLVDEPQVSSKHCRLSQENQQLFVEDLDSTNGTWVNRARITGPTRINRGDQVNLGTRTVLSWQQIDEIVASRIVTVGRNAENDIVLNDDRVSGIHAKLIISPSRMTIVDLGSTNGVSVGAAGHRQQRAVVTRTDTIYFGSLPISMTTLVDQISSIKPPRSHYDSRPAAVAIVTVLVVLLVVVLTQTGNDSVKDSKIDNTVADTSSPIDLPGSDQDLTGSTQESPAPLIFSVIVRTARDQPGIRAGTAFAVNSHQLATTGSLVLFLEKSRDEFPFVTVQSTQSLHEWPVHQFGVHPRCREYHTAMADLRSRIDELRNELMIHSNRETESADSDPLITPESLEEMINKLVEFEDKWFVASEQMIHFDVGILSTDESIATRESPVAVQFAETISVDSAVRVLGAPCDYDDSLLNSETTVETSEVTSRIVSRVESDVDSIPRWIIGIAPDHMTQDWMGSPVLTETGEIIGIYSRPTPALEPDQPPAGDRCDVVSIQRIARLVTAKD